jgi:hypothetical protein
MVIAPPTTNQVGILKARLDELELKYTYTTSLLGSEGIGSNVLLGRASLDSQTLLRRSPDRARRSEAEVSLLRADQRGKPRAESTRVTRVQTHLVTLVKAVPATATATATAAPATKAHR